MKDADLVLKGLKCLAGGCVNPMYKKCEYFVDVDYGMCDRKNLANDAAELIEKLLKEKADWHNSVIRAEPQHDNVQHPGHYTFGKIEVIDYIRDKLTPEEYQGGCAMNVLKYVSRWRHKNGLEDLKKAKVYLNWMIESVEKENGK